MQLFDNKQKKESFESVLTRVSREDFESFYKTHNQEETRVYFNIGLHNCKKLIQYYHINKTKDDIVSCSVDTWGKKPTSTSNKMVALKNQISREDFYNYYIVENHSSEEVAEHFNISYNWVIKLIREFDCKKPKTLSNSIAKKTLKKNFGNENYNNREKASKTCESLYGVNNPSKMDDFYEKAQKTWISHGYTHPMRNNDILLKQHTSLLNSSVSNNSYHGINSSPNSEFMSILNDNKIDFEREFCIDRYFYDFKAGNTLVEINPSATHNSLWNPYGKDGIDKFYHMDKSNTAKDNGFNCICIWDWDDISKIIPMLKQNKEHIYARKCKVDVVDKNIADEFLNKYHLQNTCQNQSVILGLHYNNELVQIMTFGKPRYNKKYQYELLRLCTKSEYIVVGGAEKLFKYFLANYSPKSIISYCDLSKFNGDVYLKLGMRLLKKPSVSIHWYNMKTKQHITDNFLRQHGVDQLFGMSYGKGTNNNELMESMGFVPIYDSGQATFVYENNL